MVPADRPVSWDGATAMAEAKAVEQLALPLRQLLAPAWGRGRSISTWTRTNSPSGSPSSSSQSAEPSRGASSWGALRMPCISPSCVCGSKSRSDRLAPPTPAPSRRSYQPRRSGGRSGRIPGFLECLRAPVTSTYAGLPRCAVRVGQTRRGQFGFRRCVLRWDRPNGARRVRYVGVSDRRAKLCPVH
jgi:hypothetical protein